MKIRTKFLLNIFVSIIITGFLSLIVSRSISKSIVEKQIKHSMVRIASSNAQQIESTIEEYRNITELLAIGNFTKNLFNPAENYDQALVMANERINNTLHSLEKISRIRILNDKGIVIISSHEDTGEDDFGEDIFIKAKERIYFGDIHISIFTGNLVMSVSSPIFVNNVFSGVIVVNFNVEEKLFIRTITSGSGLGKTGEVYLVNKDGYMISPSRFIDDAVLKQKIDMEHFKSDVNMTPELFQDDKVMLGLYKNYMGWKVLRVHTHIPKSDWHLFVEISTKEAFAPVYNLTQYLLLLLAVLLVIGITIAIILSKAITRPIIKLHHGTEQIEKGNLDYKVGTKTKDEIGQLSRAFDTMTDKLKIKINESERQRISTINIANDLEEINVELQEEIAERKQAEKVQKTLYDISSALNTIVNMDELFGKIRKFLSSIIDTTNIYVALFDEKTETISFSYVVDEKDKLETFPIGKSFTAYVIKTGKPLFATEKVQKELVDSGKVNFVGTSSKVWLGVPLKIENKVIGVVAVHSYTDQNLYSEKDVEILEFVSDEIALAIKRKQAEEQIKGSEESYHGLFNCALDAIYIQDKNGSFVDVNKGAEQMYGYPREYFVGKTPEFLSAPGKNDMKKVLKMVQKAFMGEPQLFEFYGLRKNGDVFPKDVQLSGGTYFGEQVVIAYARDITERKKAEQELKKRLHELEIFYNATLGREERIIELKHQVNKLLVQLGKEKKFKV